MEQKSYTQEEVHQALTNYFDGDAQTADQWMQEYLPATSESESTGQVVEIRPTVLECDVVRFQNKKEKWVAFVGLLDGKP